MPSVGSIASSKIISGEAVVKKPSSALPSSPYFSSSSDRASSGSDNADAENNPPQGNSSSMIKSSSASPFSDAFLSGQPMTDLARKDPPTVCFEEAFFSSEGTGGGIIAGSETATRNDSTEVEMQPQPSWTRTRLRALESQISSLAVDPATAARGRGTRRSAPPMTLSKEMISKSQVVAQVDDKFIVINAGGLLCIVDQHAASERVGLERLERRLVAETASQEDGGNQQAPLLRSVPLLPAQAISLSPGQFAVVQQNKHLLSQWRFTVDLPDHPSEPLLLKGVPGISDKLATRQDFLQYLQALESRSSDAALVTPAFIKRTIASQACRYAIMFGDPLSHEAQKSLIEDVSKCNLPFICAHGRPSIVPLLSLENLGEE
jgi:DNA mismatch repair ATPase MutL